jgi:hypothetical protein
MNPKATAICLILLLFAIQPSGQAMAAETALPATLAKALEGAELDTRDGWAFRQTVTVRALDEPDTTVVTRWDPSKPDGEQCTVVSVTAANGQSHKDDACKGGHERETYGDLISMLRDATIQTISEDDERAIYSFEPQGDGHGFRIEGVQVGMDDDDVERLVGTLEVAKTGAGAPYVERYSIKLKEPAGNLLARVHRVDVIYNFAPDLETGAKLLRGLDVSVRLSIITFFNVTTDVSMRFDEYRKL